MSINDTLKEKKKFRASFATLKIFFKRNSKSQFFCKISPFFKCCNEFKRIIKAHCEPNIIPE